MKKVISFIIIILYINCIRAAGQANQTLSNLTPPTAVNVDLLPGTNNTTNLGIVTKQWNNLHLSNAIFFNGSKNVSFPGIFNVFIGQGAGAANTTGSNNIFIGTNAGLLNTTGIANTFVGTFAGDSNTTGITNSFFGSNAGRKSISGNSNSFFGASAGFTNTTANDNCFFGANAGFFNTTGASNCFFGKDAGGNNATASNNSFFGANAGDLNTTGTSNCFFGKDAGGSNLTSNNNSFFGRSAGMVSTSGENSFFGALAGDANTTGTSNCFFGRDAGGVNVSGIDNSFYGRASGANSTGSSNSFYGRNSGSVNTTGGNNTCIGFNSNVSTGTLSNATTIGSNSSVNASNKVRIGRTTVTVVEGQVAYSFPSDGRFKSDIKENVPGLSFITKLRPVTYQFETKKFDEFLHQNDPTFKEEINPAEYEKSTAVIQSGFIAQEVEHAMKETGYDFNGVHHPESNADNYSMSYELMVVPLVKAVQELATDNAGLKSVITDQQSEIETLKAEMEMIKKALAENSPKQISTFKLQDATAANVLGNAIPNPGSTSTSIQYQLGKTFHQAEIAVSDIKGNIIIRSALAEPQGTVILDISSLSQGIYYYSLMVDGSKSETKQFTVVR